MRCREWVSSDVLLPSVAPAPRSSLLRGKYVAALVIFFVAVLPFLFLTFHRLIARSFDGPSRRSDSAYQGTDVAQVDAIPWTVDGGVPYPLAARPADEWANGAQRAWIVGLTGVSGFGAGQHICYATNGNVLVILDGASTWQNTVRGWDISGGSASIMVPHGADYRHSPCRV